MSGGFVVEVRNARRAFGATVAVDDVSVGVGHGEIFGLLGPSGCGKTTLLRLIGGLEHPDRGTVLLNGVDVTDLPAHRRTVHTVFQSYALFPRMSVESNVAYGLRAARVDAAEVRTRVAEALELVGLAGKERRRPHQLSGGEQQRVALARALINRPPVLLLDEPLAALDAHLRREMQVELRRIQRDTGCAFILVTHDQDEAFSLCDRVAVMFHGRVAQVGPPDELSRRPASVEVAAFVGRSSVVPAVWSDGRGLVAGTWPVAAETGSALADGDACALVLRPRQLRMNGSRGIKGRLQHVAFSSDRYEATVLTEAGPVRVESDESPGAVGGSVIVSTDATPAWALPAAIDISSE
jgi:ABC-type Fe3+/spermidine/putrescine transport system ATPase subunit